MTAVQLNRATLARQLLLRRHDVSPADAVRQVAALQAQEPVSPYIALWNRVLDFDPGDLDTAFTDHVIVKATLMRITLHAVHRGDYPSFHRAMTGTLRAARLNDRRFGESGLSAAEAEALIPHLLDFAGETRTKDDIEAMIADRLGARAHRGVWWALRHVAPIWHSPSDAPWSFARRPTYIAAGSEAVEDHSDAVQHLIRRYLWGFGPASPRDLGQFTSLRQSTVRPALAGMTDLIEREGPDGEVLLDVAGAPLPDGETPATPRLMAMWDSALLAYKDRSRLIPDQYRRLVIQRNGDVLPTVLVDGYVTGVWRPVERGIEVSAFRALSTDAWEGLATEAVALIGLLADREPTAYRRYGRWWSEIPAVDTKVLPE